MAKYMGAVMQEKNGTCTVLRCDAQNNSDPNAGPIQRYGRIVARYPAKHLGDAIDKATQIDEKGWFVE